MPGEGGREGAAGVIQPAPGQAGAAAGGGDLWGSHCLGGPANGQVMGGGGGNSRNDLQAVSVILSI